MGWMRQAWRISFLAWAFAQDGDSATQWECEMKGNPMSKTPEEIAKAQRDKTNMRDIILISKCINDYAKPEEGLLLHSALDRLGAAQADRDRLDKLIGRLASHITFRVEGEPSRSESAVDCAIRLLTELSFWRDHEASMPECPQDQNCSCLRCQLSALRAGKGKT